MSKQSRSKPAETSLYFVTIALGQCGNVAPVTRDAHPLFQMNAPVASGTATVAHAAVRFPEDQDVADLGGARSAVLDYPSFVAPTPAVPTSPLTRPAGRPAATHLALGVSRP